MTGSAYPQKSALSVRNNPRLPIEGIAIHRHAVGTQRDVSFHGGETLRYNHYSYLRCVCVCDWRLGSRWAGPPLLQLAHLGTATRRLFGTLFPLSSLSTAPSLQHGGDVPEEGGAQPKPAVRRGGAGCGEPQWSSGLLHGTVQPCSGRL